MGAATLEERVRTLETELQILKNQFSTAFAHAHPPRDAWRETVGMFRGDPIFREIIEAGKAIREAEQD
jgi:hypothetical protein